MCRPYTNHSKASHVYMCLATFHIICLFVCFPRKFFLSKAFTQHQPMNNSMNFWRGRGPVRACNNQTGQARRAMSSVSWAVWMPLHYFITYKKQQMNRESIKSSETVGFVQCWVSLTRTEWHCRDSAGCRWGSRLCRWSVEGARCGSSWDGASRSRRTSALRCRPTACQTSLGRCGCFPAERGWRLGDPPWVTSLATGPEGNPR